MPYRNERTIIHHNNVRHGTLERETTNFVGRSTYMVTIDFMHRVIRTVRVL